MAERLQISEIFFSIQGESTYAGQPCTFVRLMGCNLRCSWCDSAYTFQNGTLMSVEEVVDRVATHPTKLVEITGGEPLLQRKAPELAQMLLDQDYTVLCETSGERNIDLMPVGVRRIMDLKPPGSGEAHRNDWENVRRLRDGDELKFVVSDRTDFDWMVEAVQRHDLLRVPVHASPVFGKLEGPQLAEWILASQLPIRLNLQLHKFLWGDERGR